MRGAGPKPGREEGTATLIPRARPLQRILGNSQLYRRSPQPATASPCPAEVSRSSAAAISFFLLGAVLLLLIATRRRGRKRGRGGFGRGKKQQPPSCLCASLWGGWGEEERERRGTGRERVGQAGRPAECELREQGVRRVPGWRAAAGTETVVGGPGAQRLRRPSVPSLPAHTPTAARAGVDA